jgi:hypothetical protein
VPNNDSSEQLLLGLIRIDPHWHSISLQSVFTDGLYRGMTLLG